MKNKRSNNKYQTIWMFPRNKRKIHPWWLSQVCKLLSLQTEDWDQKSQDKFCSLLEKSHLKRKGSQYCPSSGGARTYISQLKCLGLIFVRPSDKSIWFTRAGEQFLKGDSPLTLLQKILLRLQFPSPYSLSQNVNIDPKIKIKPFQFILSLMSNDSGVGAVNINELMIPIIYGHNSSSFKKCKEKIERLRKGESIENVIDSIDDLWTLKGNKRDIGKALKSIKDIANTAKNYLQSARLIVEQKEGKTFFYELDSDFQELITEEINSVNFINFPDNEESFQRQFGCLDRKKDTRNLIKNSERKDEITTLKEIIRTNFLEYCGNNFVEEIPEEFVKDMVESFGIKNSDVIDALEPIIGKALTFFEETFLSLAKGEGDPKEFEKSLISIFKQRFHFNAVNTSNRKRPSGVGGYADGLIIDLGDNFCGLIDAKASARYSLSSDDYLKMKENYIMNYEELLEAKGKKLEFCLYVAGGFNASSIKNKLYEFSKSVTVPVSAITAKNLFSICNREILPEDQVKLREFFCKGKLLELDDIFL